MKTIAIVFMLAAVAGATEIIKRFEAPGDGDIIGLASDPEYNELYAIDMNRVVYNMDYNGNVLYQWEFSDPEVPSNAEVRGLANYSETYLAIMYCDGGSCWVRFYHKAYGDPMGACWPAGGSNSWGLSVPEGPSLAYGDLTGSQWSVNKCNGQPYLGPISVPFTEHYDIACLLLDATGHCVAVACGGDTDTIVRVYDVSTEEYLPERTIATDLIPSAEGLAPFSYSMDALWVSSSVADSIYAISVEPGAALRPSTWAGIKTSF